MSERDAPLRVEIPGRGGVRDGGQLMRDAPTVPARLPIIAAQGEGEPDAKRTKRGPRGGEGAEEQGDASADPTSPVR